MRVAVVAILVALAVACNAHAFCYMSIGDWGRDEAVQSKVAGGMAKVIEHNKCSFIVTNGDNIYPEGVPSTDDKLWKSVYEDVYSDDALQVPWYPAAGNHDYYGYKWQGIQAQIDYSKKSKRWSMPSNYYNMSINTGDGVMLDIVIVDTINYTSTQQKWLEDTLAASTAPYLVVHGHYPVYSGGGHGNVMINHGTNFKELLEKHEVTAYVAGHDHDLQHLAENGVDYALSGGGSSNRDNGGHLPQTVWASASSGVTNFTVTADHMFFSFVDENGDMIHYWHKEPRQRYVNRASYVPPTPKPLSAYRDRLVLDEDPEMLAEMKLRFAPELAALEKKYGGI